MAAFLFLEDASHEFSFSHGRNNFCLLLFRGNLLNYEEKSQRKAQP
jgi:hypothetical protein